MVIAMNDERTQPQEAAVGFWKQLALAVESFGDSSEKRLEQRVRQLEAEVSRLGGLRSGTDTERTPPPRRHLK